MKKTTLSVLAMILSTMSMAQTNPAILKWLQNNTVTGTYYKSGSSTALPNGILVNCQKVEFQVLLKNLKC